MLTELVTRNIGYNTQELGIDYPQLNMVFIVVKEIVIEIKLFDQGEQ